MSARVTRDGLSCFLFKLNHLKKRGTWSPPSKKPQRQVATSALPALSWRQIRSSRCEPPMGPSLCDGTKLVVVFPWYRDKGAGHPGTSGRWRLTSAQEVNRIMQSTDHFAAVSWDQSVDAVLGAEARGAYGPGLCAHDQVLSRASLITSFLRSNLSAPCGVTLRHSSNSHSATI